MSYRTPRCIGQHEIGPRLAWPGIMNKFFFYPRVANGRDTDTRLPVALSRSTLQFLLLFFFSLFVRRISSIIFHTIGCNRERDVIMEVDVLENYIKVVSKRVSIFESFLHFYVNMHAEVLYIRTSKN